MTAFLTETVAEAAKKRGGTARNVRAVGHNDSRHQHFELGRETATFLAGNCTDEVLAANASAQMCAEVRDIVGLQRYSLARCYREMLIGEVPVIK